MKTCHAAHTSSNIGSFTTTDSEQEGTSIRCSNPFIMYFVAVVNDSGVDVNFYIGIILSITGSLFSTVSLALQRLSHKRNQTLPEEDQKPASRQKLNIIGVIFLFLGSLIDFAALGFAPATVISCMGSLTLVLNMILAPLLISEAIFFRDVCVNAIVIIGTLISVWFGPHDTPAYDLHDLMRLVKEPTFIMYQSLYGIWVSSLLVVWMDLRKDVDDPHYLTGLEPLTRRRLLRFSYPSLAGSIGGMTAAYAKASIELVKTSILGGNQFTHVGSYFIVLMMVGSIFLQITFLNAGLKRYEAMYVVPVYQVFWIISGILAGMFYFHEISGLSEKEVRLFSLGAGISITGIILHSKRSSHHEEPPKPSDLLKDVEMQKEIAHEIVCKERTYLLSNSTDNPFPPEDGERQDDQHPVLSPCTLESLTLRLRKGNTPLKSKERPGGSRKSNCNTIAIEVPMDDDDDDNKENSKK